MSKRILKYLLESFVEYGLINKNEYEVYYLGLKYFFMILNQLIIFTAIVFCINKTIQGLFFMLTYYSFRSTLTDNYQMYTKKNIIYFLVEMLISVVFLENINFHLNNFEITIFLIISQINILILAEIIYIKREISTAEKEKKIKLLLINIFVMDILIILLIYNGSMFAINMLMYSLMAMLYLQILQLKKLMTFFKYNHLMKYNPLKIIYNKKIKSLYLKTNAKKI